MFVYRKRRKKWERLKAYKKEKRTEGREENASKAMDLSFTQQKEGEREKETKREREKEQ